MKTTLYYFSGTGNSLKVAKDLAKELGNTKLIPVPKAINQELNLDADIIGLIFPVYMFGPPPIMKRFAEKIRTKKYLFAIATNGGMPAGTLNMIKKLLKQLGTELNAGFTIRMPGNYAPMYGAEQMKTQKKYFAQEKSKIKKIAEIVRNKRNHRMEGNNFFVNFLFTTLLYNIFCKKIPELDNNFWADERCNSCGTCQKICPVNNVKLVNGKPKWHNNCEQCFACLQWCPQQSIQYGKNTGNRKRYHQPEISIEEIISSR